MPRWHRDSLFTAGPRQPLDREQRARFLYLARIHHRHNRLSAAAIRIAEALPRLLGADGRLDPSHGFLGRLTGLCDRTVRRALNRLRGLGLLFWQRRLVRDAATGWRCEQTSNAYALTPGDATVPPACDGQAVRPVVVCSKKKEAHEGVPVAPQERQAALEALAAIAARRMRVLGLA